MPRRTGTERVSDSRMKPKGKGMYTKFSYFTGSISSAFPVSIRGLFCDAVPSGQLTPLAAVRHWFSSYPVWFLASFLFIES